MLSQSYVTPTRSGNVSPDNEHDGWLDECEGFAVHAMFDSKGKYLDGRRDEKPCILNDIDKATQAATAIFDGGDRHPNIPADWLHPVPPSIDDYAVPFKGKWKGQLVKVTGQDCDTKLYDGRLVSTEGGMSMDLLVPFDDNELVKIEYPPS